MNPWKSPWWCVWLFRLLQVVLQLAESKDRKTKLKAEKNGYKRRNIGIYIGPKPNDFGRRDSIEEIIF